MSVMDCCEEVWAGDNDICLYVIKNTSGTSLGNLLIVGNNPNWAQVGTAPSWASGQTNKEYWILSSSPLPDTFTLEAVSYSTPSSSPTVTRTHTLFSTTSQTWSVAFPNGGAPEREVVIIGSPTVFKGYCNVSTANVPSVWWSINGQLMNQGGGAILTVRPYQTSANVVYPQL